jgi:amino acid adenylation domain-containing protein
MVYLLQHLLQEAAAYRPHKEAVRFQGQGLTYAQLDALTNQLAEALRAAGVRRGDRVGIYVHKSLSSIIGVFGILKAGGVYVPLDPAAPIKRLAYITCNCDVHVLLTSTEKSATLPTFLAEGAPLRTLVLMDDQAPGEDRFTEGVRIIPWADVCTYKAEARSADDAIATDIAYVLYTSGSTGQPKGVMIAHQTIFTFINWCAETFHMTEHDRVTSHAPLHFDLSTFDVYATIKAGGTVVLVPENLSIFPVRLTELLQNERITMTYLVPSILSLLVSYGELATHDLSELRTILFAGEVFPIKYLRQLAATLPHADYYNLYGPTETNVCTYYKVQPKDLVPERTAPVPIGVACANTEVFAVDARGGLVTEPGQEGELWVRGPCVAQGYWGNLQQTAQSFVRNPFHPHLNELVYRTGDIVTLDRDGMNWLYLGRRDHMIKSRGYRIELAEIEAAVYNHRDVKEVAVVAVPDDLLGNRLKAFVVPLEESGLTTKELQAHCGEHLPRYMVPESIEFCAALPKTSTGKIDRQRLAHL